MSLVITHVPCPFAVCLTNICTTSRDRKQRNENYSAVTVQWTVLAVVTVVRDYSTRRRSCNAQHQIWGGQMSQLPLAAPCSSAASLHAKGAMENAPLLGVARRRKSLCLAEPHILWVCKRVSISPAFFKRIRLSQGPFLSKTFSFETVLPRLLTLPLPKISMSYLYCPMYRTKLHIISIETRYILMDCVFPHCSLFAE